MIQVIDRAIDILEILGSDPNREFSLSEISAQTGLQKSTCSNILKSLEQRDYVEHYGKKSGYCLGYKAFRLVNAPAYYDQLKALSQSAMQTLFDKTGETVVLAVIINNQRMVIADIECQQGITAKIKHSSYLYRSATGRVIAAFYPEKKRKMLIDRIGLPGEEDWPGIIDREKLETELSAIRSHGIARTSGEFGVVGVAVPIHYKESVVASIGICLPEFRFGGETQFAVEYNLLEASKKIEEKLSQGIMIQKI